MSFRVRIGAIRGNLNTDHLQTEKEAANSDTDAHDIPVPDDFSFRPSPSYPGCFGLPYQDHNYGAPPPMSPPPPPPKSPTPPPPVVHGTTEVEEEVKVPAVSNEEEVVEDSITRCICGFLHDDGYMICCDKCSVWQHIDCMDIDRNNIPESYCCEVCEPRELDVERARKIQLRRKEEIDTSATDTDPEEPANALASLGRKPVQPKPKGTKQRRVSKTGARLLKTGRLAKSQQLKRDKKLKLTKKEKENMKDAFKKQKIGKTGVAKEKKMKKKLNTSLTQNKADFWNFLNKPLCPVYGILENEYSPEILEFLSHVKTNGVHSPHSIGVFPEELLVQLYKVSEIKKDIKGLEATQMIVPGKAVIEFKGKVMLRQHYLPDLSLNQSPPYVLYYSKFEGLDLCIDASAFGGDARFIRRSCMPNAEMCHIIDNGKLHFIVQAKKEILKGAEITIPFDFNYQESPTSVECSCERVSCPVAKFWKKVKLAQKSPEKTKRKRQASGEGRVRRNSQGKSSPVKVLSSGSKSPVKHSPTKHSPSISVTPVLSPNESSEAVDVTAPGDSEFEFPSLFKFAGVPRRSSRASTDVKEERDVKPLKLPQCKETTVKVSSDQESIPDVDVFHSSTTEASAHLTGDTEVDSSGESHRKPTREERKMEAIMKAFEKMEKREERRKEALARLDKKHADHIKEEPTDGSQVSEACSVSCVDPVVDSIADLTSLSPVNSTTLSPEVDGKLSIKLEDPPLPPGDSPQKAVRHKRIKRKRRNSRVMSAIEPLYSSPPRPPPPAPTPMPTPTPTPRLLMSAPIADPFVPGVEEVKEEPLELPPVICTSTPSTPSVDLFSSMGEEHETYLAHRRKKLSFNDSSGSRSPEGTVRDEEMFVTCTQTRNSMEHIQRRNSTSATYGRISDTTKVNAAKKRWLRQVMYETVPLRVETDPLPPRSVSVDSRCLPVPVTPSAVPGPSATVTSATMSALHSPNGSPPDFVTPLKKRRVAPEFLPSTSSAALATLPVSEESAPCPPSPVVSVSTATSSTIVSPPTDLPATRLRMIPSQEKRPRMKGTCLFGRKNGNGLSVPSSSASSACDGPVSESSASSGQTSARTTYDSLLDTLTRDVQVTLCPHQTGSSSLAGAGSLASSTVGNLADSAEATSEGSSDSPGATASSSSAVCVIRHLEPGLEVPLVDSSDAALDTGQVRVSPRGTGSSDSVGVCSSNNEVSTVCVNSADSDCQEDRCFRRDEVMAESSSVASSGRPYQDQDEDISESQPFTICMEVEDEGNEASGSVSVSEELSRHTENISCAVPQPAADCQVNSSQDFLSCRRIAAGLCSPSQEEAECRLSSQPVHAQHRTEDSRLDSADASERTGVSSALDSSPVDRERSGVSSAKDITAVSSVVSMLGESESLGSSDMECGPSSSTQASHCQPMDTIEPMICNSSDVTGSSVISFACEESNVDSTTQSGYVVRVDLNQCDMADSHLQAAESEESCCDSNSDEQAEHSTAARDRGSVSSSGPADSQGDDGLDSRQGGVSTSSGVLSCSTASVSSSHYSTSRPTELSTTVSSSVYSSVHGESPAGSHMANMASTSTLSSVDNSDLAAPSQSTSQTVHTLPSHEANPLSTSQSCVMQEEDNVDTSDPTSDSPFAAAVTEQCEASTSSTNDRRSSEDADLSSRPVSSSLQQSPPDMEMPVSSGGLDTPEDRVLVNEDQLHLGMVSSFSEDSSSNSCTNPSAAVSSSEAQAAPATKRKVSLSEYRSRRKTGPTASTSSATSPKSSSDHHTLGGRDSDYISLNPLPLFEPNSIRENGEQKEENEKRVKPMSLSDRLRIEFGLETTSEDEEKDSSSGHMKTNDIPPPPPPLPRSGKVGGVGGRRPGSNGGPQTLSAENEEESRQASSSTFTSSSSSSSSATVTTGGSGRFSSSAPVCHRAFNWMVVKVPSTSPVSTASAVPDMGASSALHPHPSSSAVFSTSTATQRLSQPYNVAGSGGSQVPNGSHPPAPAAFSTTALYAASTSQGQSHPHTFPPSGKQQQQQAPTPPPPPSTAYPQHLAQSRTHCLRAQTPPAAPPRHMDPLGSSTSMAPAQQASAPVGNGVAQIRPVPMVNSSSNHSYGRYHFSPFSRNETVNHKGSYSSDRKRR
ncbi:hypothetical protein ACOMHN_013040 [Nucella lapillus]